MNTIQRYESQTQAGLFFWAESTDPHGICGGPPSFMVVSQVAGFPGTEACDDWFCNFADADRLAQEMADGRAEPTV